MSNRPKGVWGHNPTTRSQHQRKPRIYHPVEYSDGCSGNLLLILVFALLFTVAAVGQPAHFTTKVVSMDVGEGPEWYDSEMFISMCGDTLLITTKAETKFFDMPGVVWVQVTESIWTAAGPDYFFEYSENGRGRALRIKYFPIHMLCLYSYDERKSSRL